MFLREHPWPDQTDFRPDMEHRSKKRSFASCIPGGHVSEDEDDTARTETPTQSEDSNQFRWSPKLKQAFREELEKLVILDYIMRNTDRGLDNWMIKMDPKTEEVTIAVDPRENGSLSTGHSTPRPLSVSPQRTESNTSRPYRRYEAMESRSETPTNAVEKAELAAHIGAIDNSLSWPWKHPDAVRHPLLLI